MPSRMIKIEDIINVMIRGGWPESLNIDGENKFKVAAEYVQSLLNEDVKTVDGIGYETTQSYE